MGDISLYLGYIIGAPILTIISFMLRRTMIKLDGMMNEKEIRTLIKDKLDPIYVKQSNVDSELRRIDHKLDRILDLLLDEKRSTH